MEAFLKGFAEYGFEGMVAGAGFYLIYFLVKHVKEINARHEQRINMIMEDHREEREQWRTGIEAMVNEMSTAIQVMLERLNH